MSAAATSWIEVLRRKRNLGPDRIAQVVAEGITISGSALHNVLVRLGINRLRDLDRPTGEQLGRPRYERATSGELIHVDVKKLGKFRPGGGWRVDGRGSVVIRGSSAER